MTTPVLVTRHTDNHYTARALALADIVASGSSEVEAIAALCTVLADVHAYSHIVQVDIPILETSIHDPWLRIAGIWAEDPSWETFQEEITSYRADFDSNSLLH